MTKINYKVVYGLHKYLKMNTFDKVRYYLRGIYIDKDGYTVTDGQKLVHIGDNLDIEKPFILNIEVLKNLAYVKGQDFAEIEDNKIKYVNSTIDNISLDAKYPEWKKVIPTTTEFSNHDIFFETEHLITIGDFLKKIYDVNAIKLAKYKNTHIIDIIVPESEQKRSDDFPADYNIILMCCR